MTTSSDPAAKADEDWILVTTAEFGVWRQMGELRVLRRRLVPRHLAPPPEGEGRGTTALFARGPHLSFEEEHNLLVVGLSREAPREEVPEALEGEVVYLPFAAVRALHPLSARAAEILPLRIEDPEGRLGAPIFEEAWTGFFLDQVLRDSRRGGEAVAEAAPETVGALLHDAALETRIEAWVRHAYAPDRPEPDARGTPDGVESNPFSFAAGTITKNGTPRPALPEAVEPLAELGLMFERFFAEMGLAEEAVGPPVDALRAAAKQMRDQGAPLRVADLATDPEIAAAFETLDTACAAAEVPAALRCRPLLLFFAMRRDWQRTLALDPQALSDLAAGSDAAEGRRAFWTALYLLGRFVGYRNLADCLPELQARLDAAPAPPPERADGAVAEGRPPDTPEGEGADDPSAPHPDDEGHGGVETAAPEEAPQESDSGRDAAPRDAERARAEAHRPGDPDAEDAPADTGAAGGGDDATQRDTAPSEGAGDTDGAAAGG